ncbi:hypothetical protein [Nostoc sp. 'Lobaria pulmonaria (5183) cyanobiont']|uniref:hypothetical protein n=1 Tax=Nostoc sp. 'Lobaria pulmonaria (5183) cyanobiont' TaxID=1618022 RepID=UPI000CF30A46|nr:hypothetical protein [Nostoc sp. 'Lobaria pulmonaria (5183) cyanobiont']AVH73765.1 hypothetical protein NLP_5457 [Nostoc sp. 'Lobaria pulmonaria (5183) cyanobiont']
MSSVSLYFWIETYLHIFSKNIIYLFHNLEFRDYISGLTLAFTLWNYWNTEKKFAALNSPVLKAELELPTFRDHYKLFPIYPNYKVINISDKKAVDIKIEVKIYSLKRKYKIWQSCWLDRSVTKFDNLEPKVELKFTEYFQEFLIFKGRLFEQRETKEYAEQNYIENIPIKAIINVYYSPVLYQVKRLRVSKTYNLVLKRAYEADFTQEDFLYLMPNLLKLDIKLFLCVVNQLFVYQNLLPKLELQEMVMYRTHYWKLQEIEKSWQFPFKLF